MITRIEKWGDSQGVRLARPLLAEAGLSTGDAVQIEVCDGLLTIIAARKTKGSRRLTELVARIPKDYEPEEVDWGAPRGGEAW